MSDRMDKSLADFNAALTRATKELTEDQLVTAHRALTLQALTGVVQKTPVDTGRTRGNWQTTVGAPAQGELEIEDKTGSQAIANGRAAVEEIRPFGKSFITNNSPNIVVLEEGGYVPADPPTDEKSLKRRRASRSKRERARAQAATGNEGGTFVKGGFSMQAPQGMVAVTLEELKAQFE